MGSYIFFHVPSLWEKERLRLWKAQLGVRVVHDEVQRGLVRTMVLDCLLVS